MPTTQIRILAVDDEPDLCTLTKEFLEKSGEYKVDTAYSVKEARAAFNKNRYDIIVSDYQMPIEDGIQFLISIRASGDKTPFILLTGKGREEVVIEALNNGVDSYMQKGWEPVSQYAELEHRIRSLVQRHQAEESLRESEECFRNLSENAFEGIGISIEGVVIAANRAISDILGYRNEEMIGLSILDFISPESRDLVTERIRQNALGSCEVQAITKTGDVRLLLIRGKNITWKGKTARLSSFQDITEQRNAEEELRKTSEEKYRIYVEQSIVGMVVIDNSSQYIDANQAACEMLGYSRQELLRMTPKQIIAPDEEKKYLSSISEIKKEGHTTYEVCLKRRDGNTFPTLTNAVKLPNGTIIAFFTDITSQKRAENGREALYAIGEAINRDLSLEEILQTIHKNIKKVMYAENCYIALYNADNSTLSFPLFVDQIDPKPLSRTGWKGLTEYVLKTEKPLLLTPELLTKLVNENEIEIIGTWPESWLGVPLSSYSRTIGILVVQSYEPGKKYTDSEKDLLAAIGNQAARVIERKRMEETLREGEERFRQIFNHANDAIHLNETDEYGVPIRIMDVDDVACKMLGYTREELLKVKPMDLATHHRDPPMDVFLESLRTKGRVRFETKSEERFRTYFDNSPEGIFIVDAKGNYLDVNETTCHMLGYTREEILDLSTSDITDKSMLEVSQKKSQELKEKGSVSYETILVRKDGARVPVFLNSVELPDQRYMAFCKDVTERKRVGQTMRQALAAIENSIDGMAILDVEGRYVFLNQAHVEIYGYGSPQELLGKSWRTLYDQKELVEFDQNNIPELLKNGHWRGESVGLRKDGSKFIQEVSLSKLEDGGLICVVRDISEKSADKEALKSSESRLGLALDASTDGFWDWNIRTGDTFYSRHWITSLGYSPEKVPAKAEFWNLIIHPDDAVKVDRALKDHFKSRTTKYECEARLRTASGEYRPYLHQGRVVEWSPDGSPLRMVGTSTDITERKMIETELKESEEFHRRLMSSIPVGIVIIDPVTRNIESVNDAAVVMFGSAKENIIGHRCHSFLCPALEGACPVCDCGKVVDNAERVMICADGSRRPVLKTVNKTTIQGEEKLLECFLDITERKQAEEALRQANRKLNLLSSITRHDINNQTTALVGNLALLELTQPGLASDEHFRKAEAAVSRISAMIQFTKEYEDIGVNAPRWQNIQEVIEKCAKDVPLGTIHFTSDVPSNVELYADPLIIKVFHNLLDNAVRHGGKITTVRLSLEQKEGVRSIVYQDDGVGIAEEIKQKLFSKGSGKDHGFGLFLSREILAITGITIEEVGEPGKGAKFVMTVPADGIRASV